MCRLTAIHVWDAYILALVKAVPAFHKGVAGDAADGYTVRHLKTHRIGQYGDIFTCCMHHHGAEGTRVAV